MANGIFASAKKAILDGDVDLLVDDIRVVLVDAADYTVNLATHDFLDDIPVGARVAVSGALASKTTTAGTFDAADVTLSAVTGDQSEAVVFYVHTGNDATARLLFYIDTGVTGLPVTPNGNDIDLIWNASGIIAPMGT